MPESSEVRIITEGLKYNLQNKQIINIEVLGGRYKKHGNPEGMSKFLKIIEEEKVIINDISCKGKFIYWEFSNGWYMWNTLGMSGGWTFKNEKHSNIKFEFKETSSQKKDIYFRDMRNFGTLKFSDSKKKLDEKLSTLGPDMFLKETTFEVFKKALNKKQANLNKTLPELLLKDQKTVSGVGNYIKSESLYIAKISPHRKLKDITETELKGLFQAIKKVIKQSYENKGVSKRDYSDINDEKGTYHNNFLVYGLKKDLKGNSVKTETTKDGRTTYWVPEIQK